MSGTTGCRIKLPKNMTADFFINMFVEKEYGDQSLLEMLEDYEEEKNTIVYDPEGRYQEQLRGIGEKLKRIWGAHNPNAQLERVLVDIPAEVLGKMFPGKGNYRGNHIMYLETAHYDAEGNPIMETYMDTDPDTSELVKMERQKKDLWWLEYDLMDRHGSNAKVCDEAFWKEAWEAMLEGFFDRVKMGGIAEAIVKAHKENVGKHPAITPALESRVVDSGKGIFQDEDGNDCMEFYVDIVDDFDENWSEAEESDEDNLVQSF